MTLERTHTSPGGVSRFLLVDVRQSDRAHRTLQSGSRGGSRLETELMTLERNAILS
jgi:hypothetical protein